MLEKDPLRETREAAAALVRTWVDANPDMARAMSRDDLVAMGKNLWGFSYKHTQDDQTAFSVLAKIMEDILRERDPFQATLASSFLYLPMEQITLFWSSRWADQAFPVFQMGHKYAAALMATSVTVDEDSIKPPFHAFLIEVPLGLISIVDEDGKFYDVRHVLAQYLKDNKGQMVWNYAALTTGRVTVWQHAAPTKAMLEEDTLEVGIKWSSYSFGLDVGDRDQRVNFLIQRLILNTCLAVASPENMKSIGKTGRMSPGEIRASPEPIVRNYQVGKPIMLDCREAVRGYIEGRQPGKKLSVQVLVAGHWKRQPHGPKSMLRKMIWREPYWRGPEDAPVLTRPHKLDDA